MKQIFIINTVFLGLIGFILLFNPELLLNNSEKQIQGLINAKLYGISIFCMAIITSILVKEFAYTKVYKQLSLCIIAFHFATGLYFYSIFVQNATPHIWTSVLHLTISGIFLILYLRDINKFED